MREICSGVLAAQAVIPMRPIVGAAGGGGVLKVTAASANPAARSISRRQASFVDHQFEGLSSSELSGWKIMTGSLVGA